MKLLPVNNLAPMTKTKLKAIPKLNPRITFLKGCSGISHPIVLINTTAIPTKKPAIIESSKKREILSSNRLTFGSAIFETLIIFSRILFSFHNIDNISIFK